MSQSEQQQAKSPLYEIQKDIPMPGHSNGKRGALLPALKAMSIGDSILIPLKQRSSIAAMKRNLPGTRFATRTVDANTARVWRTA